MFPLVVLGALLASAPSSSVVLSTDGHIALAHGVLTGPSSDDLRSVAREFVLLHRAELGLPIGSTLGPPQAFSTRFGGSVHLPQLIDGVEVYGGKAIVTFDLQGRVVRVASSLRAYTGSNIAWNLTGPGALLAGARQINGALFQSDGSAQGGYQRKMFPVGDEVHAGFLVWIPTWNSAENWHLAIDATDGSVLWSENRVHRSFDANVYAAGPGGVGAGIGITPVVPVTLDHFPPGFDGGALSGEHVRAFNCCPTANCALDAGPRHFGGLLKAPDGGLATFDLAVCDVVQRATNDPALHPSGNYVYAPVDPPVGSSPSAQSPADFDVFAEVHAYFHVNKVYDFVRALSNGPFAADSGFSSFTQRDEQLGKVLAVMVNTSQPVVPANPNEQGVYFSDTMKRDNDARFFPRENMSFVLVNHQFDTDLIMMSQGDKADPAYDGTSLWHEFGHAMIYSTANWPTAIVIDSRSANDEAGALHEGLADAISFMVGQNPALAPYTAYRETSRLAIRNADNNFKCPDVLWGEVHQDSQHLSGALWQARTTLFQGSDQGGTFDAAIYAAIVSFPPDVGFEKAAVILAAAVGLAFPGIPTAQAQLKAIFDARGVSNCSKVVDVTNAPAPRIVYLIPGTQPAGLAVNQLVPGPYQLKVSVPKGAKSVRINPYVGGSTRLRLLAKANQPIVFKRGAAQRLTNDADKSGVAVIDGGVTTATALIDVPCGGDLYFTVANTNTTEAVLINLAFGVVPADSCPAIPDAGMTFDAGMMVVPDAGPAPVVDAGPPPPVRVELYPTPLGTVAPLSGCGCNAASPGAGWLLLVSLALLGRRIRPRGTR
jgi:hypothetical protein